MWITPAELAVPEPGADRQRSLDAAHRYALIKAANEQRRRTRAERSRRRGFRRSRAQTA